MNHKIEKIVENNIEYEIKIHNNGDKCWYLNDLLHREEGPAIEYASGYKAWWIDGKLHRLDGPAIELLNGDKSWWIEGIIISVNSQKEFERYLKLRAFE